MEVEYGVQILGMSRALSRSEMGSGPVLAHGQPLPLSSSHNFAEHSADDFTAFDFFFLISKLYLSEHF